MLSYYPYEDPIYQFEPNFAFKKHFVLVSTEGQNIRSQYISVAKIGRPGIRYKMYVDVGQWTQHIVPIT
jgi:hypothetical protein